MGGVILMKSKLFTIAMISVLLTVTYASLTHAADNAEKFPLSDISVEYSSGIGSIIEGQMTNNSGRRYETAIFKISFFDGENKLLGAADVVIMEGFEEGDTVTFMAATTTDKDVRKWKSYKVRLEMSD
jgi:hypothetical protein